MAKLNSITKAFLQPLCPGDVENPWSYITSIEFHSNFLLWFSKVVIVWQSARRVCYNPTGVIRYLEQCNL